MRIRGRRHARLGIPALRHAETTDQLESGNAKGNSHSVHNCAGGSLDVTIRSDAQDDPNKTGAVFVMTNDADRNEVISFKRESDGSSQAGKRFSTGGRGTGGVTDPLESQGSLTLSQDHSLLFAVNASRTLSPISTGVPTLGAPQTAGTRLLLTDGSSTPRTRARRRFPDLPSATPER